MFFTKPQAPTLKLDGLNPLWQRWLKQAPTLNEDDPTLPIPAIAVPVPKKYRGKIL